MPVPARLHSPSSTVTPGLPGWASFLHLAFLHVELEYLLFCMPVHMHDALGRRVWWQQRFFVPRPLVEPGDWEAAD